MVLPKTKGECNLVSSSDMRSKIITLRIPKELDDVISNVYRELGYMSKSDFIRDAIYDYIEYLTSKLDIGTDREEALYLSEEDYFKCIKVIMV